MSFGIVSIIKIIVVVVILKLEEEGKFFLNDFISKFFILDKF